MNTQYAIMLDKNTAEIINLYLFDNLVFKNGEYLPPYSAPTNEFFNVDLWKNQNDERRLFAVENEIVEVSSGCTELQTALENQYTYDEAKAIGFFQGGL